MKTKEQMTRLEKILFRSQTRLCKANTGKYANTKPLAKTGNMVCVQAVQQTVLHWRIKRWEALECQYREGLLVTL